ncbi:hypothetical protein ACQU0X_19290 [Pseudovibrio ascidiaceicola]|uniref:hypothetical protein n=1 Tax=Pseudovibrio ascidiaceicola TaxID=285279 RepID=UPI003D364F8E
MFGLTKKPPYRTRCQHGKSKTKVDLEKFPPGTAAFNAECDRKVARFEGRQRHDPKGTLGFLFEKYRDSHEFKDLKPRTRKEYQKVFNYLKPIDEKSINSTNRAFITKITDKAKLSMESDLLNMSDKWSH